VVAIHLAGLLVPRPTAIRTLVAVDAALLLGLAGAAALVPSYFAMAGGGVARMLSLEDLPRFGRHFHDLWRLASPLGAYHRHLDVEAGLAAPLSVGFRRAFLALYVAVVVGLAWGAVVRRRASWLFLAVFPVVLTLLGVTTPFTASVHHIILMKPFVYVGAAVLAARALGAPRARAPVVALWVLLVSGSAFANLRAVAALADAPPLRGTFGVSWNAVEAWQFTARADLPEIVALDWGVFFPGLVGSRPNQRWDMALAGHAAALDRAMGGRTRAGLLFRAAGPHAWLRTQTRYAVLAERVFDAHPGDAWILLVLGPPRAPAQPSGTSPSAAPTSR
jgi:hypothetical protein